ncbi:MAG: (d)CMP kinase [Propionibacteriales bacterium]|nr:(d)CMP kinase [Propionibacteriales bacterium]
MDDIVIAIDGPAGSGKSTASRGVAQRLGLRYLDTGAMYRAMTWQMLLDGVDVTDADAVARRAETVVIGSGTNPEMATISLNGVDVSTEIRSDEVTSSVSAVSAVPRVRELLRVLQRTTIGAGRIVVEGRDIGTVVVPDATLKVYLSADPGARAFRRSAELDATQERDLATVEAALRRRDAFDSGRTSAPLSAAADAVMIDSTFLSLDDVIDRIVGLALERVRGRSGV